MKLTLLPRCVRTKVRWRLLLLTSVPIMLTLAGMIALTLYWTLTYSWQNLLTTVRSDLGVAHHAITVQQQRQTEHLEHLPQHSPLGQLRGESEHLLLRPDHKVTDAAPGREGGALLRRQLIQRGALTQA